MNKLKRVIKRILGYKIVPMLLVFIAGILIGGLVVNTYNHNQKKSNLSSNSQTSFASKKRDTERLEESRDEANQKVAEAVKNGKLDKEKADALTKKLEEAYKFAKENPSDSAEARAKIREKRLELRKWAKENDVPSSYFMRLY